MTGWLPAPVEELFGPDTTAEESYEVLTVDVPPTSWLASLETARDDLGCTYFDWLSAVDEPGTGFRVSAHVVALAPVRRLLVRTTVPHDAPVLPSAVEVYAGAAWHERETHEMFGVTFEGHPGLDPLLLPEGFEGHPLRKDFVLAARVAKAWPGAKEPGESEHGGPKRRQMLPPGVPDPNEWGPLKGQLPPAPARPARGTARAAGDRPVRRARTAGEGSASQAAAPGAATGGAQPGAAASGGVQAGAGGAASPEGGGAAAEARPTARRARSVSEGSATQRRTDPSAAGAEAESAPAPAPASEAAQAPAPTAEVAPAEGTEAAPASEPAPPPASTSPRRARTAGEGSASQRQAPATPATPDAPAPPAAPSGDDQPTGPARPRSSDAPWHHARPAFDEADQDSATEKPPPTEQPAPEPESTPESEATEPSEAPEADSTPSPTPDPSPTPTDDENPPGGRQ
ncbi:NADH-quinone oxidoreductase subunit C [Streptomyces umbrinus]